MLSPTDHGVPGSNPPGVPFVHLQMGDAKAAHPKKFVSVIWIWKWEMRKSTHRGYRLLVSSCQF